MTVQKDKKRVLVACALPDAALAVLNDAFDVTVVATPEHPEPEQVVAMAKGSEILLLSVTLRLTRELVERLPDSIRGVATYSVGYEHIDMDVHGPAVRRLPIASTSKAEAPAAET